MFYMSSYVCLCMNEEYFVKSVTQFIHSAAIHSVVWSLAVENWTQYSFFFYVLCPLDVNAVLTVIVLAV